MSLLLIPIKILRKLKQIIVQYLYITKTKISFLLTKNKKKLSYELFSELITSFQRLKLSGLFLILFEFIVIARDIKSKVS